MRLERWLRAAATPILTLGMLAGAGGGAPAVERAAPAAIRGEGAPIPRIATLSSYRRSGDRAYWETGRGDPRWTPEEILRLLEANAGYYADMGVWTGLPTGHARHREMGRVVNELQALGRARGVDTSRIAVQWRNDVMAKLQRAPVCDPHCGWEGTLQGHPFDPSFMMTVPRSEHAWAMDHRWGGDPRKDPWGPGNDGLWPRWIDRPGMRAANTPARVAALYGGIQDLDPTLLGRDLAFRVSGVMMDLRNPSYRAWSVEKLVADLRVMGLDPGEPAALLYAYKPGWHTWWGGGRDLRSPCYVPDSHMWSGPTGPCLLPGRAPAGPFERTPYGPGEFEAALNAMLRELRAGLVAAGYESVKIVTVERPKLQRVWRILEPDLRRAPWILGELGDACDRNDASRPGRCPRL
jgi:hypothetical protein